MQASSLANVQSEEAHFSFTLWKGELFEIGTTGRSSDCFCRSLGPGLKTRVRLTPRGGCTFGFTLARGKQGGLVALFSALWALEGLQERSAVCWDGTAASLAQPADCKRECPPKEWSMTAAETCTAKACNESVLELAGSGLRDSRLEDLTAGIVGGKRMGCEPAPTAMSSHRPAS